MSIRAAAAAAGYQRRENRRRMRHIVVFPSLTCVLVIVSLGMPTKRTVGCPYELRCDVSWAGVERTNLPGSTGSPNNLGDSPPSIWSRYLTYSASLSDLKAAASPHQWLHAVPMPLKSSRRLFPPYSTQ